MIFSGLIIMGFFNFSKFLHYGSPILCPLPIVHFHKKYKAISQFSNTFFSKVLFSKLLRCFYLKSGQVYYKLTQLCAGTFPDYFEFLFLTSTILAHSLSYSVPLFTFFFWFFSKNVWEKFQLWAGSIWSKPVPTLVLLKN